MSESLLLPEQPIITLCTGTKTLSNLHAHLIHKLSENYYVCMYVCVVHKYLTNKSTDILNSPLNRINDHYC